MDHGAISLYAVGAAPLGRGGAIFIAFAKIMIDPFLQ
jgi:hypothetical protein